MQINLYGGLLIATPEGGGTFNLYGGTIIEDQAAAVGGGGVGRWFNTNARNIPGANTLIVSPYNYRIDK